MKIIIDFEQPESDVALGDREQLFAADYVETDEYQEDPLPKRTFTYTGSLRNIEELIRRINSNSASLGLVIHMDNDTYMAFYTARTELLV